MVGLELMKETEDLLLLPVFVSSPGLRPGVGLRPGATFTADAVVNVSRVCLVAGLRSAEVEVEVEILCFL